MRAIARIVVLCLVALAANPQTSAAGILSWLGRMSGPGPFVSYDANVCIAATKSEHVEYPPAGGTPSSTSSSGSAPASSRNCPKWLARYDKHWTLYARAGLGVSTSNDLDRGAESTHAVWVADYGASLDYTAAPWVEAGVAGGVDHFFGDDFKGFVRPFIKPHVTVRPALLGKRIADIKAPTSRGEGIGRSIFISVGWHVLFADLNGASFGAAADPWPGARNESRLQIDFGFDPVAIFSTKKATTY
jgi:hypothetical protein